MWWRLCKSRVMRYVGGDGVCWWRWRVLVVMECFYDDGLFWLDGLFIRKLIKRSWSCEFNTLPMTFFTESSSQYYTSFKKSENIQVQSGNNLPINVYFSLIQFNIGFRVWLLEVERDRIYRSRWIRKVQSGTCFHQVRNWVTSKVDRCLWKWNRNQKTSRFYDEFRRVRFWMSLIML